MTKALSGLARQRHRSAKAKPCGVLRRYGKGKLGRSDVGHGNARTCYARVMFRTALAMLGLAAAKLRKA